MEDSNLTRHHVLGSVEVYQVFHKGCEERPEETAMPFLATKTHKYGYCPLLGVALAQGCVIFTFL